MRDLWSSTVCASSISNSLTWASSIPLLSSALLINAPLWLMGLVFDFIFSTRHKRCCGNSLLDAFAAWSFLTLCSLSYSRSYKALYWSSSSILQRKNRHRKLCNQNSPSPFPKHGIWLLNHRTQLSNSLPNRSTAHGTTFPSPTNKLAYLNWARWNLFAAEPANTVVILVVERSGPPAALCLHLSSGPLPSWKFELEAS